MKNRHYAKTISARISTQKPLIQVVVGPRQVGKTTAIKAAISGRGVFKSADFPTPLPPSFIEEAWSEALLHPDKLLVIDEVQKISGWSEVVKKLWEESPFILKVILSGSAALLIDKGLKESLSGRFELIRVDHWSYEEARDLMGLSLSNYLEFGCYPGSVPLLSDVERWASYIRDSIVEPAIGRDILQLQNIENPALLRQVFGLALTLPAKIISINKLQGSLSDRGAVATIAHYLNLLEQGFLLTALNRYSDSSFRVKRSPPKIIIHDNALLRAFHRPVASKITSELLGHYFENLVGARLIQSGADVYYWTDRAKEVDFVVITPDNEHLAIEVKSGPTNLSELSSLLSFVKGHPKFRPVLISLVDQQIDGIETIPVERMLSLKRRV